MISNSFTLDGNGHTVTAVDPVGGRFLGAVVRNGGAVAGVVNLTVTALNLVNVCDPSTPVDTRLRGIMFEGAAGVIAGNTVINLNQGPLWTTNASWASSAILLYQSASGTVVRHNNIMDGNADVGIWMEADGVTVDNNRVFESGADGAYDIGVGDWGTDNVVTNNKVRGYETAYDGVTTGNNKAIPSPHDQ